MDVIAEHPLKEEDTIDMLLSLNDEISWSIIARLIAINEVDCKDVFVNFFNANEVLVCHFANQIKCQARF